MLCLSIKLVKLQTFELSSEPACGSFALVLFAQKSLRMYTGACTPAGAAQGRA